jgi:hypothetical protein
MDIWDILWQFGIFNGHLGYFMTIWYILCSFGIFFQFWFHAPWKIWQPWVGPVNVQPEVWQTCQRLVWHFDAKKSRMGFVSSIKLKVMYVNVTRIVGVLHFCIRKLGSCAFGLYFVIVLILSIWTLYVSSRIRRRRSVSRECFFSCFYGDKEVSRAWVNQFRTTSSTAAAESDLNSASSTNSFPEQKLGTILNKLRLWPHRNNGRLENAQDELAASDFVCKQDATKTSHSHVWVFGDLMLQFYNVYPSPPTSEKNWLRVSTCAWQSTAIHACMRSQNKFDLGSF